MSRRLVPGQPALLRELNDRAALTLLLGSGAMTRNELAARTGLSKVTAAEIIRRLEVVELIRESGTQPAARGPSAVLYEAAIEHDLGVAVDLQRDDIRASVVDAAGASYPTVGRHITAGQAADAHLLIARTVEDAAVAAGVAVEDVVSVCVGVQASVNHATDSLSFSEDLFGWPASRVSGGLADRLGMRVVLENDANLAAVAERNFGAGVSLSSFALMWVAEGLGMALDISGSVHSGATGAAGELGYLGAPAAATRLDPKAEIVADLVLDSAVVRLARHHGVIVDVSPAAAWRTVLDAMPELEPQHPFLLDLAERIGHNILPALAVADPEVVILHGPTGLAGGGALAGAVTSWLRTNTRWATPVVSGDVVVNPVLQGARHALIEELRGSLTNRLTTSTGSPAEQT